MRPGWLLALAAALAAWPAAGLAAPLSAAARAGQRIYLTGESPSGVEITARVGRDGTPLSASIIPCAGCHGRDGLGRPEGGARPQAITWPELTKPYGHVHPGRSHPPFDERSFARAVEAGVDPAGNPLDPTMPRYALSRPDLASLVAYLKVLDRERDPGVGDRELRLGTIVPVRGATAAIGAQVRAVLEGYLEAVTAAGGVNGRRVELVVEGYDAGRETGLEAARRLIASQRVFALVSGYFPEAEREVFALAERERVPLIGPFAPLGGAGPPLTHVFHLVAGVREQARVLAEDASARLPGRPQAAVVHAGDPLLAEAAAAGAAQLRRRGWERVELLSLAGRSAGEAATELAGRGVEAVILLAPEAEVSAFQRESDARGFRPMLFVPGVVGARAAAAAPPELQGRIRLAYPALPSAAGGDAARELARIEGKAHLGPGNRIARIEAFAAAAVCAEALRRAGASPRREALVTALEGLYRFEPGLIPAVSYGSARRVGALGAYIVALDPADGQFRPEGGFVELE